MHFQEQQEKEQQMAPVAEPPKIQFSRGELTGMGLAICLLMARSLDAFTFGDEDAAALGVPASSSG